MTCVCYDIKRNTQAITTVLHVYTLYNLRTYTTHTLEHVVLMLLLDTHSGTRCINVTSLYTLCDTLY